MTIRTRPQKRTQFFGHTVHLIFPANSGCSPEIGRELAPAFEQQFRTGCCGVSGPVPRPLSIREPTILIQKIAARALLVNRALAVFFKKFVFGRSDQLAGGSAFFLPPSPFFAFGLPLTTIFEALASLCSISRTTPFFSFSSGLFFITLPLAFS